MSAAREAMLRGLRGENEAPVTVRSAREAMLLRLRGQPAVVAPAARPAPAPKPATTPVTDAGATCGPLCRCVAEGLCEALSPEELARGCTQPHFADGRFLVWDEASPYPGRIQATCACGKHV